MPDHPSILELSDLDGANGFRLDAPAPAQSGLSISTAGDVIGDGLDDIVVNADTIGQLAYVVFGSTAAFNATLDLQSLDGADGFAIHLTYSYDGGFSVSSAGDVNGDGFDDVMIGSPEYGYYHGGGCTVVFGSGEPFSPILDAFNTDGGTGFFVTGNHGADDGIYDLGYAVSSAGDLNGDGFDDIIVGSPQIHRGRCYVVYGAASFADRDHISAPGLLDGSGQYGFVLRGTKDGERCGTSVSSAGDFNQDGIDDIIIGANGVGAGVAYVVFGALEGFGPLVLLQDLDGVDGFKFTGELLGDAAGTSVAQAGDVNGDGFADLIVGASGVDTAGTNAGAAYVIFSAPGAFGPTFSLSTLNGSNGFQINGEIAGGVGSVSGAGDINGDGFGDLIVGAPLSDVEDDNSGAAYVVFGRADGFATNFELSAVDGNNGFRIDGVESGDNSGRSVSGAGDVNGDGFDDLLISAPGSGDSYVVFGSMPGAAVTRTGTETANIIHGGNFNDSLSGRKGNDTLFGHAGRDFLDGGSGDDALQGGLGKDTTSGRTGADIFVFASPEESTGSLFDTIRGANFASVDRFDIAGAVTEIDAAIEGGALSRETFDADLAATVDDMALAATHAVIFTSDAGSFAGKTFLVVDANSIAGYQAGADIVVMLAHAKHLASLDLTDFI